MLFVLCGRFLCLSFLLKVLDANATMVSMVVEALASLAEACGKGCGEAFLRRALFPVLEKVRSRLCALSASFFFTLRICSFSFSFSFSYSLWLFWFSFRFSCSCLLVEFCFFLFGCFLIFCINNCYHCEAHPTIVFPKRPPPKAKRFNQPINLSTNRLASQAINAPINQSTNQNPVPRRAYYLFEHMVVTHCVRDKGAIANQRRTC